MRLGAALVFALSLVACSSTTQPAIQPAAEPAPIEGEPAPTVDPRVDRLETEMIELVERMEVLQARMNRMEDLLLELSERSVDLPSEAVAEPAITERYEAVSNAAEAYREALILIAEGRMEPARAQLEAVYRADPTGDLADNALYWIAETHFETGSFQDAIRYYDRVVRDFQWQNKAPDAMLRKSLALVEIGDLDLARDTLQKLIETYPYSTAASAARLELERIRY